jgi:tetratricopeptide (TPR) repeat protein
MKTNYSILLVALFFTAFLNAQEVKDSIALQRVARGFVREGNELYKQEKYTDAGVAFKKALEKNASYEKASYNLGNALYQQDNFKEALPQYEVAAKGSKDKFAKAEAFHNIGNTVMKEKQYQQAVDAYKNSLRNNPNDDETRYNLAIAQKELKKENKNKDDKKDGDKDKDSDSDQDKDGDDKKDGDKKENKDGDKDKDDKKDGDKDKNEKKSPKNSKDQKDKPTPKKGTMSPQQIKQLLEILNNEEKKTQKKMNVKKSKGKKIKQEKDW